MRIDRRALLMDMFRAAVDVARPSLCVPPFLPAAPKGRTIVVGAGKAAASMAAAVEANWSGPIEGLVVTRYGHGMATSRIEVVEAAHPVPDEAGSEAARRIIAKVRGLTPDDLVLCLISGGGSSLLAAPAGSISLEDKQSVNRALLKSGADIREMNCVRKHLSSVKGGRLALAAAPAPMITLIISDVPGDDPSIIASGPTVPDPTTMAEALAVIAKYKIQIPPSVRRWLDDPCSETPKSKDPRFWDVRHAMIAAPHKSLQAAAKVARAAGIAPLILGDAIEGEAREVAKVFAGIACSCALHGAPLPAPCVLLSGGETTVAVRGKGRGGRNVEFLLALAIALDGRAGISALAADTDGIDGIEESAGAVMTPETLLRAAHMGLDAKARLADNDGHSFFEALGDAVITGPTLTNVNDFRAIIIDRP